MEGRVEAVSVYVDELRQWPEEAIATAARKHGQLWAHLFADTEDELHAMADAIGIKRKWYQGDHYDICMEYRVYAVKLGAVEITLKQLACMSAMRRFGQPMGDPATAVERMLAFMQGRDGGKAPAAT